MTHKISVPSNIHTCPQFMRWFESQLKSNDENTVLPFSISTYPALYSITDEYKHCFDNSHLTFRTNRREYIYDQIWHEVKPKGDTNTKIKKYII